MIPTLSIIVPVFQVELYLDKCLQSLVSQTLENIEILIINDGSSDGSQKIIENFQRKYPEKIRGFQKINGGLSDARNFGLDRATGEYIGFVDSDDEVTLNMFAEMYALAKKHNADITICNLQKVNERGEIVQNLVQIPHLPEKFLLRDYFSAFSDVSYFACNKIYKCALFKEKRFKKNVHFEDIQLIPQLFLDSITIAHTQEFHYKYLERASSISKTHSAKGLDILAAVDEVSAYFENSQYSNYQEGLKNFQILEGIYTFLAYSAFVKDSATQLLLQNALNNFIKKNHISLQEILTYKRFGRNYLLSLPLKKKIYYILIFTGLYPLLRKFLK